MNLLPYAKNAKAYDNYGTMKTNAPGVNVYFGSVDIGKEPGIAKLHNIKKNYDIFYFSKDFDMDRSLTPHMSDSIVVKNTMMFSKYKITKNLSTFLLSWINRHSSYRIVYKNKTVDVLITFFFLCLFLCVLIAFTLFIIVLRRYPFIMALGALGIQILACGCICFCLIRKSQLIGHTTEHKLKLFHSEQRNQYVLEGLSMSSLEVLSTMSLYVACRVLNTSRRQSKAYLSFLLIILGYSCYYGIFMLYNEKHYNLSPTFFPPIDYVRGSLLRDRGNMF
ncbi:uncharacterized protein LOC128884087 isoform X2 [Hylaeus volcanicus]|uniref:uncharacterized protein LOC128884087 isoform X2 n=1 Tax=Hylaeus volcanicus TaxID=313075 RepID=UPI0023B7B3C9|nr:uncharacterized protein LOC128884087 isoform X2 [Hylaeus volcanicus]